MATSCTQAVGTRGMAPFPTGTAACSSSGAFQAGRCQQHGSGCRWLWPSSPLMLLCDTELGGLRAPPRPCPPSSPQELGPGKAKFSSYLLPPKMILPRLEGKYCSLSLRAAAVTNPPSLDKRQCSHRTPHPCRQRPWLRHTPQNCPGENCWAHRDSSRFLLSQSQARSQ